MNRTVLAGIVTALFVVGCGDQAADNAPSTPAPSVETAPATEPVATPEPAPAPAPAQTPPADAAAPAGAPSAEVKPVESGDTTATSGHPLDPKSPALETTPSYSADEAKQMAKDTLDKAKDLAKEAGDKIKDAAQK